MKTQNVSFQGGLNLHKSVSPEVSEAIKKSPAMKRFGMLYNADVYHIMMGSGSKKEVTYSSLAIDNVRPRNLLVSLFDFVTGRSKKRYAGLHFNSHQQTDKGLAEVLGKMKKNSFVRMIIGNHY